MKFGLIGKTLGHSYSKVIHESFNAYEYDLVPLNEDELERFIKNPDYSGFNVTIPYKKSIIPFCDEISDSAKRIGSVNTVIKRDGKLYGYNTDYAGFLAMCKRAGIDFCGKKVAILGSGGTYNTALAVVADEGAREIVSVSRNGEFNYENTKLWNDCEIIINTTPVGMYPNYGDSIISLDDFKKCEGVVDVIYNPLRTKLVFEAQKRGCKATGGLYMLVFQAKEAYEIFTGEKMSDDMTEEIYQKILSMYSNLVLIGMPGSGKSTAGTYCSKYYGKTLIDTDEKIIEKCNMSIPDIFKEYGEEYFRNIESEVANEAGKSINCVISCGGGIIKKKENLYPLAMNSKVVLIKRDIEKLETKGRPLSQDIQALSQLEKERMPIYEEFADVVIENNEDILEFNKKLTKLY